MVLSVLGRVIFVLCFALWVMAVPCHAQQARKVSRSLASTIAIGYIVVASSTLVFITFFAFKMRHTHKNRMKNYALHLAAHRASIHNEEEVLPEPARNIIKAQPLLDPCIARLAFLKDLQNKGLISEEDYESQKARILERF